MFRIQEHSSQHLQWKIALRMDMLSKTALSDKIKEANAKLDPKERIAALQAIESEIVTEQALYLPIAAEKRTCIISPRLKNFQLMGRDGFAAQHIM